MGASKGQLEEVLGIVKSLNSEVTKLREEKKTWNESAEKKLNDLMQKREQAIKDDVVSRFRKGEHLTPVNDESVEPSRLLISKSSDPKVREFMDFNDTVYLVSKALRIHPTQTRIWKKNQAQIGELRKALDTQTAGTGSEWIPTEFSSDLIDKFRLMLKVTALFRRITMPTNPFKFPVVGGDATAYKIAESTADSATKITASTPTSANITLTAIKLAARTLFSEEMTEDAIVPVVPFLKDNLARVMADAWEDAILNGDAAASHMDIDVTAATDHRKSWDGLRKRSKDEGNEKDLSTFNLANLRGLRTSMKKYGVNPKDLVYITGPKGYAKMLGLAEVVTLDKYGPQATVLTGELAKLDGIPVVVSEHVRENLSTTGFYDGTTTDNTVIILANTRSFIIGDKRKMTLKTFEDIETDQTIMVVTQRGDFQDIYTGSGEQIVNVAKDVDAA